MNAHPAENDLFVSNTYGAAGQANSQTLSCGPQVSFARETAAHERRTRQKPLQTLEKRNRLKEKNTGGGG